MLEEHPIRHAMCQPPLTHNRRNNTSRTKNPENKPLPQTTYTAQTANVTATTHT